MWNTEAEKNALVEKITDTTKDVKCPTCGTSLVEEPRGISGASSEVLCPKCGISAGLRGI